MGCFGGTQLLVCLLSVCIAVDLARADCIWYDECGCNPDLDPGWQCSLLYLNRCTGPIGFFFHKVEFLNSFLIIFCGEYNEVHLKKLPSWKKNSPKNNFSKQNYKRFGFIQPFLRCLRIQFNVALYLHFCLSVTKILSATFMFYLQQLQSYQALRVGIKTPTQVLLGLKTKKPKNCFYFQN